MKNIFSHPPHRVMPIAYDKVRAKSGDYKNWGYIQLGMDRIDLTQSNLGKDCLIAIVDDAANFVHPDVYDPELFLEGYSGNFTPGDDDDAREHGVGCASIAFGLKNGIGTLGYAPNAYRAALKVLYKGDGTHATGSLDDIQMALKSLLDTNRVVDGRKLTGIINLSLGGRVADGYNPLGDLINALIEDNWIIFAAAGNSGGAISYPGSIPELITVGSYNKYLQKSEFSSIGKQLDVVMPGENILSAWGDEGYVDWSGTSAATPAAAGVCGLICSDYGIANQKEFLEFVDGRYIDMGTRGEDEQTGKGYYDVPAMMGETETAVPDHYTPAQVELREYVNPLKHIDLPSEDRTKRIRELRRAGKHLQSRVSNTYITFEIPRLTVAKEVNKLQEWMDSAIEDVIIEKAKDFTDAPELIFKLFPTAEFEGISIKSIRVVVSAYAEAIYTPA